MGLNVEPVFNAIVSHALATGYFDRVITHEPKSAPRLGIVGSLWRESVRPIGRGSGLNITSVRATFRFRILLNFAQDPLDMIDINLSKAEDAMFNSLHGDFTLGGVVRNIDLVGDNGLRSEAGHVEQDGKFYRFIDIFIPVVINDVWEQSA